ncbi:hypothetical protein HY339_03190 [Candidatus Gottesmanbacteria bacterium]|nr:hypothetical protein [Candidatus Gottesmanbacteria bacterium]
MKTKEDIITFLQNEPLIEWKLSVDTIDWLSLTHAKGGSLFFGVGLCTAKEAAAAIPFDILTFFLVAEKLKKFFELARVIVLIADRHARTNTFMTQPIVEQRTRITHSLFDRVIQNLHLRSFEVRRASHMLSADEAMSIVPESVRRPNQYLAQEIADVIWMTKRDRLTIKLGWTIDSAGSASGHDERFFDLVMRPLLPHPISFVFTQAGRTFDRHRQKASPYIATAGQPRLLLDLQENAAIKLREAEALWGDPHLGGTKKHLGNIVRLFEGLFGHLPGRSLEQKIQHVLDASLIGDAL